jgi:putative tryptophan/tyrosine transport system substrate-binding protein
MRRRELIFMLGGAAMAWPFDADAQQHSTLRIGEVSTVPRAAPSQTAFVGRLRELGYTEGRNLALDVIDIQDHPERYGEAMKEVVRRQPDVIFASGPELALKSALAASRSVPIVMLAIGYDPVALGYSTNLARPSGNITGVVSLQIEVTEKRLQIFAEAFPEARSATVFWDKDGADSWRAAEQAAAGLGLHLEGVEFRDPPYDYERSLDGVSAAARHSLFVTSSTIFFLDRARLADFALRHRMVSCFWERELVDAGGLMSYGTSLTALYRRAAEFVDKIARGAKPGDLPIEQPTKFDLVINLRTAKALGLTVPPLLLARANEVIE